MLKQQLRAILLDFAVGLCIYRRKGELLTTVAYQVPYTRPCGLPGVGRWVVRLTFWKSSRRCRAPANVGRKRNQHRVRGGEESGECLG